MLKRALFGFLALPFAAKFFPAMAPQRFWSSADPDVMAWAEAARKAGAPICAGDVTRRPSNYLEVESSALVTTVTVTCRRTV